ncbi:MAG: uncharacterized protein K0S04_4290, partial [Herbinix sp.]|nr:uncharacterized protein [Herbinix sp.]
MTQSNYDKKPFVEISGFDKHAYSGYEEIINEIRQRIELKGTAKTVVTVECYPGVKRDEVLAAFMKGLNPALVVDADNCSYDGDTITKMIRRELTEDRVFGVMSCRVMDEFFDETLIAQAQQSIENMEQGIVLIYGTGATLIGQGDILVYADMARWEIQLRYRRKELANWKMDNYEEEQLKKYKRAFFIEWRIADRLKKKLYPKMDYLLDTNVYDEPKMITKEAFDAGLKVTTKRPFRVVPYFDPGVWGGQWMKEKCGLDNDGQNLSMQVHPLTEYIQEKFGMHYTQDESYYILEADPDAVVYLGVKKGIDPKEMIQDLYASQRGEKAFPDEKYINQFPAKKHDHFLIPAGTIHCSGKNSMVLEISATPYIFTFKLWDWDRVGLDGRPRPVHIAHGENVIQWDRDTDWVRANLVDQVEVITQEDGCREERTGLHEREFIETRRHWFDKKVLHNTNGGVNVLNLVEGREAIVESPTGQFEPFVVHYA